MKRWVFNITVVLSLLLLLATVGLWVDSYWRLSYAIWETENRRMGICSEDACFNIFIADTSIQPDKVSQLFFTYERIKPQGLLREFEEFELWRFGFSTRTRRHGCLLDQRDEPLQCIGSVPQLSPITPRFNDQNTVVSNPSAREREQPGSNVRGQGGRMRYVETKLDGGFGLVDVLTSGA